MLRVLKTVKCYLQYEIREFKKIQVYLVAVEGICRELEGAEEMCEGEHGTGRHSLLQTHGQQSVSQVGEEHGGPDGAE